MQRIMKDGFLRRQHFEVGPGAVASCEKLADTIGESVSWQRQLHPSRTPHCVGRRRTTTPSSSRIPQTLNPCRRSMRCLGVFATSESRAKRPPRQRGGRGSASDQGFRFFTLQESVHVEQHVKTGLMETSISTMNF